MQLQPLGIFFFFNLASFSGAPGCCILSTVHSQCVFEGIFTPRGSSPRAVSVSPEKVPSNGIKENILFSIIPFFFFNNQFMDVLTLWYCSQTSEVCEWEKEIKVSVAIFILYKIFEFSVALK